MRYYIHSPRDGDIHGPFTAEELVSRVGTGAVPQDSLASSDLGEPMDRLFRHRQCDWFPLWNIPELQHLFPPVPPEVRVARPVTKTMVLLILSLAAFAIYHGITGQRWFDWLWVIATVAWAVQILVQFVTQKRQHAQ